VVTPRVGGSHGDIAQALAVAVLAHATLGSGSAEGAGWYSLPPNVSSAFGEYSLPSPGETLSFGTRGSSRRFVGFASSLFAWEKLEQWDPHAKLEGPAWVTASRATA